MPWRDLHTDFDGDWTNLDFLNQFAVAVNERLLTHLSSATEEPLIEEAVDISYATGKIRRWQQHVESMAEAGDGFFWGKFLRSHDDSGSKMSRSDLNNHLFPVDPDINQPEVHLAEDLGWHWKDFAPLIAGGPAYNPDGSTGGFRRTQIHPSDPTFQGFEWGWLHVDDLIGEWIFEDLQAALNMLVWKWLTYEYHQTGFGNEDDRREGRSNYQLLSSGNYFAEETSCSAALQNAKSDFSPGGTNNLVIGLRSENMAEREWYGEDEWFHVLNSARALLRIQIPYEGTHHGRTLSFDLSAYLITGPPGMQSFYIGEKYVEESHAQGVSWVNFNATSEVHTDSVQHGPAGEIYDTPYFGSISLPPYTPCTDVRDATDDDPFNNVTGTHVAGFRVHNAMVVAFYDTPGGYEYQ